MPSSQPLSPNAFKRLPSLDMFSREIQQSGAGIFDLTDIDSSDLLKGVRNSTRSAPKLQEITSISILMMFCYGRVHQQKYHNIGAQTPSLA